MPPRRQAISRAAALMAFSLGSGPQLAELVARWRFEPTPLPTAIQRRTKDRSPSIPSTGTNNAMDLLGPEIE